MQSFEQLAADFKKRFEVPHFPNMPQTLYEPDNYFFKNWRQKNKAGNVFNGQ